ncbi:MAG: DUF4961 domain-containing protein [Ferruginibacter sp.]
MKSFKIKKLKNYLVRIVATLVVVIIISCSMTIDTVVQQGSINGGEVLPVTLNVKIKTDAERTAKLMIAVLVPKLWKVAQKGTATFVSGFTTGVQQMSIIPAGTPAPNGNGLDWPTYLSNKIGNGGNLINDWEWVAFYSKSDYALGGGLTIDDVTVSLRLPTSTDNLSFRLAYVVANSSDGLSGTDYYGSISGGCFRVNGTGDLIDFCNPQLSTIEPRTSLDNDIITIGFDAGVADNDLSKATEVYICATGITATGEKITVCAVNAASKLSSPGAGRWSKDIWPRKFFSLSDNQQLTRMEYYFTDASGGKKVGYGGGKDPFLYTFKCQ